MNKRIERKNDEESFDGMLSSSYMIVISSVSIEGLSKVIAVKLIYFVAKQTTQVCCFLQVGVLMSYLSQNIKKLLNIIYAIVGLGNESCKFFIL